ncbi:prepilin-type N-terminal cleavage/methylation domain-containing protein [Gilvimarinus sp. SDUM040013]|uniref:Prepilin-type N-terminal cleavage/methylation domain-containing protein n=1 Tax=Gilvimarinus gilvus TaxID=3058038 RepID=A0ABU4S040_9GAMM|nr:prepilin-type N-terminal cleavage/methylation domain-containing protein [Gilvimarinus sp. SDUM040013]MDO3385245.1 prepilin-type N-terminal cleavage/methylation domain-containing protein [Gilvimarinus sp. SDUM040013]MDX6849228.1 prepilin-type N-terminal cleavage/methylation domain-containing protein [Gilvimarinus sp. SDUM040013]
MRLHHKGFSLLEMLVAVAILGISFGMLYQSAGGSVRSVAVGEDYAYAVTIAQSLLAENSLVPQGGVNTRSETADGYRWSVQTAPLSDVNGDPLMLYRIDVEVQWGQGSGGRKFVLNSVVPEARVDANE